MTALLCIDCAVFESRRFNLLRRPLTTFVDVGKDFCYPAVFCWAAVAIAANANDSTNAQIVAASLSLVGIVGAAALMVVGEWSIAILREGRAAMPPAWILSTGTLGCFTCCIGDDERARRGSLNSNDRTDFNEGLLS
eukprot:SAG31_NODE_1038_length_10218_cov_16.418223_3_plen_137_part_00